MTETLRIDAQLVFEAGNRLQALAGAIPPPPTSFSPSGADALSVAIAGKVAEVVDPVLAQLPVTKEELMRYAQNVLTAAGMYDAADRRLAEDILKRLGELDDAQAQAGATGDGLGAGAAEQSGQMGQMMQMPMQLAQQAAQIPMQLAGMAGAIPAAMMQGLQSAMQQVGQVSELETTEDDLKPTAQEQDSAPSTDDRLREEDEPRVEGAAPGAGGGERAPEIPAGEVEPQAPEAPPMPAPTRPAESVPGIAL